MHCISKHSLGSGEMTQQLGALATLAEDLSPGDNTHIRWLKTIS